MPDDTTGDGDAEFYRYMQEAAGGVDASGNNVDTTDYGAGYDRHFSNIPDTIDYGAGYDRHFSNIPEAPQDTSLMDGLKGLIFDKNGKFDPAAAIKSFGSVAAALYAWDAAKNPPKTGYQGGIPALTAVRKQLDKQPDATRPGAGGHRYFTDTAYANKDNLGQVQATVDNQALGLTALNDRNAANKANTAAAAPKALTAVQKMNALYQQYRGDPQTFAALQAQNGWSDESVAQAAGMSLAQYTGWKLGQPAPTAPTPAAPTPAAPTPTAPTPAPTWGPTPAGASPSPAPAAASTNPVPEAPAGWRSQTPGTLTSPFATAAGGNVDPSKAFAAGQDGRIDQTALTSFLKTASPAEASAAIDAWNYKSQDPNAAAGTPGNAGAGSFSNNVSWMPTDTYQQYSDKMAASQYDPLARWLNGGAAPTPAAPALSAPALSAPTSPAPSFGPFVTGPAPAPTAPAPVNENYFISPSSGNMVTWDANGVHTDTGQKPPGMAAGGLTALAKGGSAAHNPRYLRGETDGMADKIPAQIDGHQPAALAHGEFVIPADVVSHLGNGNSDAGAKHLHDMMDKIRMARTGRKSQGKEINPEKFTVGGPAYAAGGSVQHFATGDVVGAGSGVTGTESSLSNWAGPYVTNMLGKGQALAESPNPVYQGPLTAGDSALQSQAYGNAANLSVPGSIGNAGAGLTNIASNMGNLSYNGSNFGSAYTPPNNTGYAANNASSSGYNAQNASAATGAFDPSKLTNYQMGPAERVGSQNFTSPGVAQSYMSPYMDNVVKGQQQDAQRQADIAAATRNSQLASQGAFGGSRSAIMGAEAARNLASQQGQIQAQGLQSAYTSGQGQFNADQGRSLAAQQANQNAGMNVGQQNLNANLQTQQLGQGFASQYGLASLNNQQQTNMANAGYGNQANQFGASAANQAAALNQAASNQASQFNASQGLQSASLAAQYGLAANNAATANNQFGANYGLQTLNSQLQATNAMGQMGVQQNQANLANIGMQSQLGGQQQATTQAGIAADQNAFNQERDNPFKMVQFQQSLLQGMPLAAQSYNTTTNPWNAAASAAGAVLSSPATK